MGMFDNYENIADNYIPSNIKPPRPICENKLEPCTPKKPYEEYNAKNELIGYWWYYGDTINLDFHITGNIVVEDDALIYTAINDGPTNQTKGILNQKAYNITDFKSWTLTSITSDDYIWTLDETFNNPEEGLRNIYISAEDFIKDKQITFTLYNFRWEEIDTKLYDGSTDINYIIDDELSKKLVKGVYYGKLTIWQGTSLIATIFQQDDCTFTVK